LRYLGQLFDSNKDGHLNFDELVRFFKLFYSFASFKSGMKDAEMKRVKKYSESMVLRIFEKTGAEAYPGVSLQQFSSLEKEEF